MAEQLVIDVPLLSILVFGAFLTGGGTCNGSLADVVILTQRDTSVQEENDIFRQETGTERYKGILDVTEDELVSSDIIKDPRFSVDHVSRSIARLME